MAFFYTMTYARFHMYFFNYGRPPPAVLTGLYSRESSTGQMAPMVMRLQVVRLLPQSATCQTCGWGEESVRNPQTVLVKTMKDSVFMPSGDDNKSLTSVRCSFQASKWRIDSRICLRRSSTTLSCCKDINAIAFYLLPKKRAKIFMVLY